MEEADIRLSEVKKAQYEFNRDIVNGAVNAVSNRVPFFLTLLAVNNKLCVSMEIMNFPDVFYPIALFPYPLKT